MAHTTATTADMLQCVIVTPEATELETPADFVALPLYDGEVGIAPGRSPLIGRLGYGELRVRYKNELIRYYVDGGFVQVADNVVSVLTNRACLASVLDPNAARRAAPHGPLSPCLWSRRVGHSRSARPPGPRPVPRGKPRELNSRLNFALATWSRAAAKPLAAVIPFRLFRSYRLEHILLGPPGNPFAERP